MVAHYRLYSRSIIAINVTSLLVTAFEKVMTPLAILTTLIGQGLLATLTTRRDSPGIGDLTSHVVLEAGMVTLIFILPWFIREALKACPFTSPAGGSFR